QAVAALEVEAFQQRVRAERESQTQTEDHAADTVRRSAADIRANLTTVEGPSHEARAGIGVGPA
ncbi:MAG TPA: hypothetical protein VFN43_03790, partial [Humibacillus sp.]|nr:hypothetical protein [Humibacillus sp.]